MSFAGLIALSFGSAFAALPTLPFPGTVVFECTLVGDVDEAQTARTPFSKMRRYSSFRADAVSDSKILVKVGTDSFQIDSNQLRIEQLSPDAEKISVTLPDGTLSLVLHGKPLSRKGAVTVSSRLGKTSLPLEITCH